MAKDEKKSFGDVVKALLIAVGLIIFVVVLIVFIISYVIIRFVARPICGWGFFQALLVLLPLIGEIAAYVIAFSGVGIPISGIILVVGAVLETISTVCDFVSGNYLQGILGLVGTIPIVGVVPQGLRAVTKVISSIAKRAKK